MKVPSLVWWLAGVVFLAISGLTLQQWAANGLRDIFTCGSLSCGTDHSYAPEPARPPPPKNAERGASSSSDNSINELDGADGAYETSHPIYQPVVSTRPAHPQPFSIDRLPQTVRDAVEQARAARDSAEQIATSPPASIQVSRAVSYRGEVANRNQFQGAGVMQWNDAQERYAGSWQDGMRQGYGVQTGPAGKYEGQWASGERNGPGVFWSPDGLSGEAGVWTNGVLTERQLTF